MNPRVVRSTQIIFYWIARAFFAVLFSQKVIVSTDFTVPRPHLLVSNHQSHADGFLIFTALPWKLASLLLPTAIMGKNRYTGHPIKRFFTGPLGMFPAHRNKYYPAGLAGAAEHLDKGFSVAIFPEGRITRSRKNAPHKGAAVLGSQKRLPIIPIHIEWNKKKLRRSVRIVYGPAFCLLPTGDYDSAARYLMQQVYGL